MWLGVDIGTSALKAILVEDDGGVAAQSSAALGIDRPQPLWSEQDPDQWWTAAEQAITALPAPLRAAVRGVGLSGQMHGAVLLGADDRPLRPAILWNDGRSAPQCAELEAAVPRARTITGNIAMPGFTAPKLLWVRENEPEHFAAVAKVLLPKDYIRLKLIGDHASDMSDSAGTLWLDTGRRAWSAEMLAACGLDEGKMPALFEGSQVTGTLRPAIARQLGLPVVPVAGGGGDNAAGAVGVGLTEPGQGFLSLGTSGVIFVVSDGFAPHPAQAVHAFCHALPDRWHQMAVILSAASCLDWATRVAGFADLDAALTAAEQTDGRRLPIFLPYLSGERTPYNDPNVRGAFVGLDHDSDRGALMRAVLEGVAFALADGADALRAAGTDVATLSVIGGGARSAFWGKILASALACELAYHDGAEVGPALGAAHLARLAVGGGDLRAIVPRYPVRTLAPDPRMAEQLAPRRERFRALYPAVANGGPE